MFFFFLKTSDVSKRSVCSKKNCALEVYGSLQSIIWVFLLNNFSRVINLLLTKFARDRPGRISALGLFCTGLATLGPYCQDFGPIFSQYGPRAWLIRYMCCVNYHWRKPKFVFSIFKTKCCVLLLVICV